MIKNGKLFCFIGAGLFLINAIIFFACHVPVLLGVASVIVAIAIVVLALLPWVRIVLDVVSIVGSCVSAYLLTNAIRQMPSAIVVPSNLLVFAGFVLVLVGGAFEIRLIKTSPSTKKSSKSTAGNSKTKKKVKQKAPKIKNKKKEYTPPAPCEYYLNNCFQYEPEVIKFVEYLKKENSNRLQDIGYHNISATYARYNIPCSFNNLANYKPNRETVTPYFFTHLMKWVMRQYKLQRTDDEYLPYSIDFAISFENLYKNGKCTPIMKLIVDHESLETVSYSLIRDDLAKARRQFRDKWYTLEDLTYDDFASNRAWVVYKKDKEVYERNCKDLESIARTLVHNHTLNAIAPIAERLYKSLNIHYTAMGTSRYVADKLVVEAGSLEFGKIGSTKSMF